MKYISDLTIKRFRGIKDLELTELGDINILLGDNNSGKTSILEAIGILENPVELGSIIRIGRKREIFNNQSSPYTVFINMLNNDSKTIDISGNIKNQMFKLSIEGKNALLINEESFSQEVEGFSGKIEFEYGKSKSINQSIIIFQTDSDFIMGEKLEIIPIQYITPIEHMLKNSPNEIIKKGKKKDLIELLNIFDKDIIGIEMVEENRKTVPFIEHEKLGIMTLSTYGDGLKKVLLLGSSIINAENGVLLIDEVETAIHIDAFIDVFKWFIKALKRYNVQVFMTTHSIEVVDAILTSQKDLDNTDFLKDSLRVITIKNSTGQQTKARILNGLKAYDSRFDFEMELR